MNAPPCTDLESRLRESADEVESHPHPSHCDHLHEAFKVMREAATMVEQMRSALEGLESMYARTWDRVDGALVMMPDSVPRFEAAHKKAREALGIPLIELDEQPDDAEALRRG